MDRDDDKPSEGGGVFTLLGLGAAALGAAWWFSRRDDHMSENEALRAIATADVMTPEGRRKMEAASVALGLARRRREGEIIDNATVALEKAKAASRFDFGSKGTRFFEGLEAFEKANAHLPTPPDPADLRKDPVSHHVCSACKGAGAYLCPRCRGQTTERLQNFWGQEVSLPCAQCGGRGMRTCESCNGARVVFD
jgi:hypothetical protein